MLQKPLSTPTGGGQSILSGLKQATTTPKGSSLTANIFSKKAS